MAYPRLAKTARRGALRSRPPSLEGGAGAEKAVKKNDKYDGSKEDVHAVVLGGESPDRECDAGDRSKDQQHQSQLNDAAAAQGKSVVDNPAKAAQFRRLSAKGVIVGKRLAVAYEIDDSPEKDNDGGGHDPSAQQIADNVFNFLI